MEFYIVACLLVVAVAAAPAWEEDAASTRISCSPVSCNMATCSNNGWKSGYCQGNNCVCQGNSCAMLNCLQTCISSGWKNGYCWGSNNCICLG